MKYILSRFFLLVFFILIVVVALETQTNAQLRFVETQTNFQPTVAYEVNTRDDIALADLDQGFSCFDSGPTCSLRAAIERANADTSSNSITITFKNNGVHTLRLGIGSGGAEVGDLDITRNLTIHGNGPQNTIIEGSQLHDRLFEMSGNIDVTIENLTLRNDSEVAIGGCILNRISGYRSTNPGKLTLRNVVITGCQGGAGGAIANYGALVIESSTLKFNHSVGTAFGGGAILNGANAALTIIRSSLLSNTSDGKGGALSLDPRALPPGVTTPQPPRTPITSLILSNSTIHGNRAQGDGGGLFQFEGVSHLSYSAITGNNAQRGGGVYIETTPTGGLSPQMRLHATIIAENSAQTGSIDCEGLRNGGGTSILTFGYNLLGTMSNTACAIDTTFASTPSGDVIGTDATQIRFASFIDNGTIPPFRLLSPGSNAIDAVPQSECRRFISSPQHTPFSRNQTNSEDQRMATRPVGNNCDIGPVEGFCGDTVTQPGEACDDGNSINTDLCTNACAAPRCGDGFTQAGEACEMGAMNSNTTPNACRVDCSAPRCGDNVIDNGEECDDGNALSGDGCSSLCKTETAGTGSGSGTGGGGSVKDRK